MAAVCQPRRSAITANQLLVCEAELFIPLLERKEELCSTRQELLSHGSTASQEQADAVVTLNPYRSSILALPQSSKHQGLTYGGFVLRCQNVLGAGCKCYCVSLGHKTQKHLKPLKPLNTFIVFTQAQELLLKSMEPFLPQP